MKKIKVLTFYPDPYYPESFENQMEVFVNNSIGEGLKLVSFTSGGPKKYMGGEVPSFVFLMEDDPE